RAVADRPPGRAGNRSRLLDRHAHGIAPLGPAAVVVADALVAEQIGEHEPGVAAPLADPAVGDDVVLRPEPDLAFVDGAQRGGILDRPVLRIRGTGPWPVLRAGDVPAAQNAFLRILRHVRALARELLRAAHVHHLLARAHVREHLVPERADARVVAV